VSAAPLAASGACATGIGNGGGEGIICEVAIANTITGTGGSAVVTVHQCLGSAGAPLSGVCTTVTSTKSAPVTDVTQCNGSANGGGATLRCSVTITNNFVNLSPGSAAVTVNQCVESGDGLTTGCTPFPATTSGAAITQCNGSANGGTLVELTCTATGTMATALPITINQCNGSGLGGGGLVICSASMVNRTSTTTPPPTSTLSSAPSNGSTSPLIPLGLLLALSGLGLAAVVTQRRSIRS
jgi:hypothetical protein